MPGRIAAEVAGHGQRLVRLPRSAERRDAVTYARLIESVGLDSVWGGWWFEGPLWRPGGVIAESELGSGLLLECAGPQPGGWGHHRAEFLYILWRWDPGAGAWGELARVSAVNHDWTLDLGPIAQRALRPPQPIPVDPRATARRVMDVLKREIAPLEFKAQVLIIRAVQDELAAGMAG